MPKYKNVSSEVVIFNSISIKPLEEVELDFYINDPRIKEIDKEPIWSPVQYSEQITSGSVKITENLTPSVNLIRIASKTQSAVISFNAEDKPKVVITLSEDLKIRPVGRINEIFVHEGEVSIELWNEFSWRG